jgi:Family of unknown function (DUF695)
MTWSTAEIVYEGLPLLLRHPDHSNVWRFKEKFTKLVSVEHLLDKVNSDGLPERKYNSTLSEFDHYMCTLFDKSTDGVIFLIETFSGRRNYYYYTLPNFDFASLIEQAKLKFNVNLDSWTKPDFGWVFLDDYPIQIFTK